jgi:hypothetical protein
MRRIYHDDAGVEAEALNARAVLSGHELDIFQLDAVPEPHDRLARPGPVAMRPNLSGGIAM